MTRKKTIGDYSVEDMQAELLRRWADENFKPGMTMSQMELATKRAHGMENPSALLALQTLLGRLPTEKPTGKLCPKCGKRAPVKASDRERALRTMAGHITLKRNYHYCEQCQLGFYPLDRLLDLPEEGELTHEMEKRVLDFAVNDVYGECAARWRVHYEEALSENLFRRVAARIGAKCEAADQVLLQEELKPRTPEAADVLVVISDGSMLPIRGADESWKEAKVGVVYRHDTAAKAPIPNTARYAAVVGSLGLYAPVLRDLLAAENLDDVRDVVWLGDGAPYNWTLADQLAPDAIQILDWFHAVEHAVDCGKVLLGEESPWLPLWKNRAEELLAAGDPKRLVAELMDCLPEVQRRRKDKVDALAALDNLVGYYSKNAHRMRYRSFRTAGLPIGSGAGESAHRHVLQKRMKLAGQHWALGNARRLGHLRAAYRTCGPAGFYDAILRAHRETGRRAKQAPRRHPDFRYARQGRRDLDRCAKERSK
jgi:hypothetical protein